MLALAVVLAAASPVPAESRQVVLSLSAGWDQTRAILQPYERPSAGVPWEPVGAPIEASLGRAGMAWGLGLHPGGLAGPEKREATAGRRPGSSTCAS